MVETALYLIIQIEKLIGWGDWRLIRRIQSLCKDTINFMI